MKSKGKAAMATPRLEPDKALWMQLLGTLPRVRPTHLPHEAGVVAGFKVILVDGNQVKLRERKNASTSHIGEDDFMDFVEGGNGFEDEELCPRDEVLIDAMLDPVCWPFIAYHEIAEARDMRSGMSYGKAHERANACEKQLRQRYS